MGNYAYNNNVPFASNDPANDQPQMLINTKSIKSVIEQDHLGFGVNNGGFHKVIHFNTQNADPTTNVTSSQLYTKDYTFNGNTDNSLFFKSTLGEVIPVASSVIENSANPGYMLIGQNTLMQWGLHSIVSVNVSYPIAFSAAAYSLNITPFGTAGSNVVLALSVDTSTATGFKFNFKKSDFTYSGIYWIAIGPK